MVTLVNRAKVSTSTTGTGATITLGAAAAGYQTFADAGVTDGDVVRYVIEDGSGWEIGYGTYTASGTTLTRNVMESSNSDAALNLSGSAAVFVGAAAEDVPNGVPATVVTVSSGTYTLNLVENDTFATSTNITSATTVALSNVPTTSFKGTFQFNTGGGDITWPAAFDWSGGVAPELIIKKDYLAKFEVVEDSAVIKATLNGPFDYTGPALSAQSAATFIGQVNGDTANGGDVTLSLTGLSGGTSSSVSTGDIVVVIGSAPFSLAATGVPVSNPDTSWVTLFDASQQIGTIPLRMPSCYVGYKVMGATPDASVVIEGANDTASSTAAVAFVFSGINTADPINVFSAVPGLIFDRKPPPAVYPTGYGVTIIGIGLGAGTTATDYTDAGTNFTVFQSAIGADISDAVAAMGYVYSSADPLTATSLSAFGGGPSAPSPGLEYFATLVLNNG